MAKYNSYKCTNCNFKITVSGPHEFKFVNGEIEALPHPGNDEPANGLYFNIYCPHCGRNQDLIIVEFIEATDFPFEVKVENIKKEYLNNYTGYMNAYPQKTKIPTECFDYKIIKCPVCKGDVIPNPNNTGDPDCPKCKSGKLEFDIRRTFRT